MAAVPAIGWRGSESRSDCSELPVKSMRRSLRRIAFLAPLLAGVVAGCGDDMAAPNCDAIAAAIVTHIDLHPSAATVAIGDSLQMNAKAFSCAGELTDVRTFQWRSGNADLATVSHEGLVKGRVSGNLSIFAAAGGKEGFASIFVRPPKVDRVTVEPDSAIIGLGGTTDLVARAFDKNDHELIGRVVTWSSANSNIASVDDTGTVTGRFIGGPVAVTATIEGKTASSAITVVLFTSSQPAGK